MQKWAWFEGNVGVVKKVVRTSCAAIFWPLQLYACSYACHVYSYLLDFHSHLQVLPFGFTINFNYDDLQAC